MKTFAFAKRRENDVDESLWRETQNLKNTRTHAHIHSFGFRVLFLPLTKSSPCVRVRMYLLGKLTFSLDSKMPADLETRWHRGIVRICLSVLQSYTGRDFATLTEFEGWKVGWKRTWKGRPFDSEKGFLVRHPGIRKVTGWL